MSEDFVKRERVLETFTRALAKWVCQENEQPLTRWLAREMDCRGSLIRLSIADWRLCLDALREAGRARGPFPAQWADAVARLVIAALRYSRPDGSPAADFDATGSFSSPAKMLRDWLTAVDGTEAAQQLRAWSLSRKRDLNFSPEAPAWDVSRGVLTVLRDEFKADGDFVAVDHRVAGPSCRFELFGGGRSWLGPAWGIAHEVGAATAAKPGSRISAGGAEIAEWSYRLGTARVTQTVFLLGGRRLALLAALFESSQSLSGSLSVCLTVPPAVAAERMKDCRGLRLTGRKKSDRAQVLPLALPSLAYDTVRGDLQSKGNTLELRQAAAGRRSWLPLLVSWDSARNRKETSWRVLTVSERSKSVGPAKAFAARVSWGRNESYVIYRSHDGPASRAFLGYRTHARFLFGLFTPDGNVTPIVKID